MAVLQLCAWSLAAALFTATPEVSTEAPRLLVLDFTRLGAVSESEAQALQDQVVQQASRARVFEVVSQREVSTLLGVERQKQLLGCGEESSKCLTELTGALDARFVLSGTINRIGETWQLTLQNLDARRNQPAGRSLKSARSLNDLRALVPWAVAEATGTPGPKPPSRVLPVVMLVAGGLALATGGVALFQAETTDAAIKREIEVPGPLPHTAQQYRDDAAAVVTTRGWGLAFLAVGAALGISGAWLYFSTPDGASGSVALVPVGHGLGLAGSF